MPAAARRRRSGCPAAPCGAVPWPSAGRRCALRRAFRRWQARRACRRRERARLRRRSPWRRTRRRGLRSRLHRLRNLQVDRTRRSRVQEKDAGSWNRESCSAPRQTLFATYGARHRETSPLRFPLLQTMSASHAIGVPADSPRPHDRGGSPKVSSAFFLA